MRQITITLLLIYLAIFTFLPRQAGAQEVPQAFKYQTVVRDATGNLIQNQSIELRMGISDGSNLVYLETHTVTTNNFGLATIEIGYGNPVGSDFENINWESGEYYLITELDATGSGEYISMGTSQLLSVPYAMHSMTTTEGLYWDRSSNDIYSNLSGNVGIGTNVPEHKLSLLKDYPSTDSTEDVFSISRGSTGTVENGIGAGLIFRNEISNGDYLLSGRISSIMEEVSTSFFKAGILFQTRDSFGGWKDGLYIDPFGKIGIGTQNPIAKLHIHGDIYHEYTSNGYGLYATGNTSLSNYYIENSSSDYGAALWAGMTNASANSSSVGISGFNDGTGKGVSGFNSQYNNFGYVGTAQYGVYGYADGLGFAGVYGEDVTGNYGYAGGLYGIYGEKYNGNYGYIGGVTYSIFGGYNNGGNYGYIGGSSYGVFGSLMTEDPGDYAIYGDGTDAADEIGTGYDDAQTLGAVKGLNSYAKAYTFAVAGYSSLSDNRSGGTFGAKSTGTGNVPWGCLAYQRTGGTEYGGYFTSYTSGSGKSSDVKINNGIGAYGDLFGADIHGKVYGTYSEGENYAMYTKGTVYNDGLEVHLQKNNNGENKVLYTNVSTDATVQTMGYVTISNGKASIVFDEAFSQIVSNESPIIVTATPTGESKGVYITSVNENGFMVTENENGKSNVTVSYIAIGKRKGYESPQLAKEVIAADYTTKLSRGLHNDGDTETDGEGLYYENGKLIVGIHPSTLPDPNRLAPQETEGIGEIDESKNARHKPIKMERPERPEKANGNTGDSGQ